jgi:hypothetical protein
MTNSDKSLGEKNYEQFAQRYAAKVETKAHNAYYERPATLSLLPNVRRCLDTAKLINVGKVEPFPALNSFFDARSTETQQTQQVRQFLVQNQDTSGAIVMVTHQVNITALSGVVPQQGEAVIMQVKDGDRLEVVAQLDPLE